MKLNGKIGVNTVIPDERRACIEWLLSMTDEELLRTRTGQAVISETLKVLREHLRNELDQ